MSRSVKFPAVRSTHSAPKDDSRDELPECTACNKPARHWVRIAWSFMRGEDTNEPVCGRHLRMASKNSQRFMAHMMTKDAYIADPAAFQKGDAS